MPFYDQVFQNHTGHLIYAKWHGAMTGGVRWCSYFECGLQDAIKIQREMFNIWTYRNPVIPLWVIFIFDYEYCNRRPYKYLYMFMFKILFCVFVWYYNCALS